MKLLKHGPDAEQARARREIAALRLLRIPGVVKLLDDGVHDGRSFLAMEFVEGRPFPGRDAASWEELASTTRAVLETLSRVHAAGVVHRDLKPENVLVDGDGRPTILDFGLSYGPALGAPVTSSGGWVGTPFYLAPEQLLGAAPDARADLYALGVMLYEALARRRPHDGSVFQELVHAKLSRPPVALRRLAPTVPAEIAAQIDRMLARDPADRPRTAGEALHALFGDDKSRGAAASIRRLGGTTVVDAVVAACRAGRCFDLRGVAGVGKSRTMEDAADALRREGRDVRWATPGSAPFESLCAAIGGIDDVEARTAVDAAVVVASRVRGALAGGACLFADDVERLDPWSRDVLDACRGAGPVVTSRLDAARDSRAIEPLSEPDLRDLFVGPDRILHLREDGAHELWTRTGGVPDRVASEVAAWVRAGVAHWQDGRLVLGRDALDSLRRGVASTDFIAPRASGRGVGSARREDVLAWICLAWPDATLDVIAAASGEKAWRLDAESRALARDGRVVALSDGRLLPADASTSLAAWEEDRRRAAHGRIAAALPPDSGRRLGHLAAAHDSGALVAEAIRVANRLVLRGQPAEAVAVLIPGLVAARESGGADAECDVLAELLKAALSQGTAGALDRVLYELGRSRGGGARVEALNRLAQGASRAMAGRGAEALASLREIDDPQDEDLRLWKWAQMARAAHMAGPDVETVVLAELDVAVAKDGSPRARASHHGWMGHSLFARGRYAEAAREFESAAADTQRVPARLSSLVGAANALMEAGDLDAALRAATAAEELAASVRHREYEARAVVLERALRYRRCDPLTFDDELVEQLALVRDRRLEAQGLLTEAAIAWRASSMQLAAATARRSAAAWTEAGGREGALLARCLAVRVGGPASAAEAEELGSQLHACRLSRVAAQCSALIVELVAAPDRVRRGAPRIESASIDRFEVLSAMEINDMLGAAVARVGDDEPAR